MEVFDVYDLLCSTFDTVSMREYNPPQNTVSILQFNPKQANQTTDEATAVTKAKADNWNQKLLLVEFFQDPDVLPFTPFMH